MLPLSRRRARRRSISRRLTFALVGCVVLALLIGGLTQVSRQSHPYDQGVNRSLAAQGSVIANESAVTAGQVQRLMGDMQTLDRQTLQSELDSVVQQTADQSALAQRAAGSASADSLSGQFAAVFVDRAQATEDVRSAIDGLLGMHPILAASASGSGSAPATPTLLTSTQATNRVATAGALLIRSDQMYQATRRALRTDRGRYRLPPSEWVTNSQTWQVGALAEQIDLVASSGSLAVVHDLILRTVRISPPALPAAGSTAQGASVLSPTRTVSVTVVLANLGSVDELHAGVQFSLAPQGGGSTNSILHRVAISAGKSVTMDTVTFGVKPGDTYQLTVAVVLPPGQASVAGTTVSQTLQIAPGT